MNSHEVGLINAETRRPTCDPELAHRQEWDWHGAIIKSSRHCTCTSTVGSWLRDSYRMSHQYNHSHSPWAPKPRLCISVLDQLFIQVTLFLVFLTLKMPGRRLTLFQKQLLQQKWADTKWCRLSGEVTVDSQGQRWCQVGPLLNKRCGIILRVEVSGSSH